MNKIIFHDKTKAVKCSLQISDIIDSKMANWLIEGDPSIVWQTMAVTGY